MDPEQQKMLEEKLTSVVDNVMEAKLKGVVGDIAAAETRKIVESMRLERAMFGKDRTGLSDEDKKSFCEVVKRAVGIKTKANEALIEETDSRGGYLVPKEVAAAIVRIAASVGIIMSQAQKWDMKADELGIPNYTGSFLEGEYLGVDAAGNVTGLAFGAANLIAKKWQLAFVVGNDLVADASVNLADWLLALGGEALANMVDKQGFAGVGAPFVGILGDASLAVPNVTVRTLPAGETGFSNFRVMEDSSNMISDVEESVLDGAAFYMNRTVWAGLRVQKDGAGHYILPQIGAPSSSVLSNNPTGGGVKPAGEILGFPVFTSRHMPAITATAVSTPFLIFGNMKALAYGDKGEMSVAQHASGSFGGKEIALADQRGLVYKHRHALVIALAKAFSVAKTHA